MGPLLRNWRFWLLAALQVGPPAILVGLGFAWLADRGLGVYGFVGWLAAGLLFSFLVVRWTRAQNPVLPPIDWDSPRTFTPQDRQAWDLVLAESERAESVPIEQLNQGDIYVETGRRLAEQLARHYRPQATNPLEHVPVVEMLTAIELAAEDLAILCREVPGGDMVTPGHWQKAVQAAGVISRANEIYNYLMPIFQPVPGLVRLGSQKLMMQPAWRSMQQNLQRWFFRAYVNRLGTHLIELYSGRLSIGAARYRRLTGRHAGGGPAGAAEGSEPLVIAVAGGRDVGKSTLIEALDAARRSDLSALRARLEREGLDPGPVDRLPEAEFVEVEGYTARAGGEGARDRSTRQSAVAEAADADLLLLVLDGRRPDATPEARFLEAWLAWFAAHPTREMPPVLAVVTGADRPEMGAEASTMADTAGQVRVIIARPAREAALAARVAALRSALPATVADLVPVGLGTVPPQGVADRLLPELAMLLHRAERAALIRQFEAHSRRSKARRFFGQVGRQGRRLVESWRHRGENGPDPNRTPGARRS